MVEGTVDESVLILLDIVTEFPFDVLTDAKMLVFEETVDVLVGMLLDAVVKLEV